MSMSVPASRVIEVLGLKTKRASIAGLAAAVQAGLPKASLARVADRAGFTGKARSSLIHSVVPSATLKRRTRLKPQESERTERLARVIALAEWLWDDTHEAQRFLNTPHAELSGKAPIELAMTELGARQVEEVVMRAMHGLPV